MKSLQAINVSRDNAIFVIVDMENEFCKPGGKLYSERSHSVMPGIISTIRGLTARARNAGIPVIYVQSVRTLREPEFTTFGHEPVLEIGTWAAEIVDELKPQKEETIVQKFSHDPFYKTELDQVLNNLIYEPIGHYAVVTGGAVNICLYQAVIGFHLRHYKTVVPVDGVYSIDEAGEQRAFEQFSEPAYPNVILSRSDLIKMVTKD